MPTIRVAMNWNFPHPACFIASAWNWLNMISSLRSYGLVVLWPVPPPIVRFVAVAVEARGWVDCGPDVAAAAATTLGAVLRPSVYTIWPQFSGDFGLTRHASSDSSAILSSIKTELHQTLINFFLNFLKQLNFNCTQSYSLSWHFFTSVLLKYAAAAAANAIAIAMITFLSVMVTCVCELITNNDWNFDFMFFILQEKCDLHCKIIDRYQRYATFEMLV